MLMQIPTLFGVIKRRFLINFRVQPEVMKGILPPPFELKLHRGYAIAGICLIRLESIRPWGLPGFIGLSGENAAHRVAVQWFDSDVSPITIMSASKVIDVSHPITFVE